MIITARDILAIFAWTKMSHPYKIPELDIIIAEVKMEFRLFLTKRRELVLKLGNAYEKIVTDADSICEELKNVLHDEITQKIISGRDIERYCPDKWKRKTKPQNDNLSFSITEDGGPIRRLAENQLDKTIIVTAEPNSVSEYKYAESAPKASDGLDHGATSLFSTNLEDEPETGEPTQVSCDLDTRTSQPEIKYEKLSRMQLLEAIQQVQKEAAHFRKMHTLDRVTIGELKAALAKTSFTPANHLPKTKLEHIVLDLQKFGTHLTAMIQCGKSACVVHMDDVGNVIDIKDGNSCDSNAEDGSGEIPS
jgi:hypothetical protein